MATIQAGEGNIPTVWQDETVEEKLDRLARYQQKRDSIDQQKQEIIDTILTPDLRQKLAEIDTEFAGYAEAVDKNIETLTEAIKAEVLRLGKTVEGSTLKATWKKGRTGTWDGKKLEGFAMAHPEIWSAKNPDGEPTVAIGKA